ncbi:arginine--tRNA ligase, cytoplasmic isoform X1 [Rhododendron vialii]|uniref:arginine--tRNA ligase, cytoplasmic isoform X1 n=2 Tax=Rhododendron vialii TaxID=182163 RepID=UPI0026604299|nr:arginine--tRNA ligase, cytoplasmic isoform X1 [Rhododendron vialii]
MPWYLRNGSLTRLCATARIKYSINVQLMTKGALSLLLPPLSPPQFLSLSSRRLPLLHPPPPLPATYILKAASRRLFSATRVQTVSTMAADEEVVGTVKDQLAKLFEESLRVTVPDQTDTDPLIAACNPRFGDYQCNNAMSLWTKIKGTGSAFTGPQPVGQAIMTNLPQSEMIESCSIAGPGFVNVKLSRQWIAKSIQKMLIKGIETWSPKLRVKRAVVDFSSPNIAKEMHVGHLRSTIIGDTLARMLEFSNVEVLRRNHVGDWGTQFGMLIEFLFEKFPNMEVVSDQAIGDLEAFYKASKQRFDSDPGFKERAQQAVVSLQGGQEKYRKAWSQICEISRKGYEKVYQRLGIVLEEKGESFYNPYIPGVLEELAKQGLIEESEGARVIFIEGKKYPFIVVKSDGGFNYASTDLTALWYRLNEEKAEWMIYVTDVGQREHFEMLFTAAKRAGWLPPGDNSYPKANHVGFGLVLGEDGKRFRTRSTEVVKLVDLLDEAKSRCKAALVERGKAEEWTEEELEQTAEAVGYGAVKYADLKNNRLTNYTFNFDQMLNDQGNTAVYLLYAHARICSIIRKSGKDVEELKKTGALVLEHPNERALGLHLLQFAEIVEEACTNLLPNVLCEYLYNLSGHFTTFYTNCQVVGSEQETSRLLLCEATAEVMRKCFYLLGIRPVYKI